MQKILLVSLSTGSGHVRAAKALEQTAITHFSKNIQISHVDFKDFLSFPFNTALIESYDILVKQAPEAWGFIYEKTNSPKVTKQLKKIPTSLRKINSSKFISYINTLKPDYILFTHFLPANIYTASQKINALPPFGILITDYDIHEFWLTEGASDYFVATQKMAFSLQNKGVLKKNIHVSGIPVDPVFYKSFIKKNVRAKLHIDPKITSILVLSGGSGLTDISTIVQSLCITKKPLHIVAIAGNNIKLKKKLELLTVPKNITLKILGWTNAIDLYIKSADIVIGKCGGMTTTECMIAKTPMLVINPIPGQEEKNAQFILEHNLGYIAQTKEDILFYLSKKFLTIPKTTTIAGVEILKTILKK